MPDGIKSISSLLLSTVCLQLYQYSTVHCNLLLSSAYLSSRSRSSRMSAQDVRSILSLPPSAPLPTPSSSRKVPVPRKPDGITRELYALIGDNAPSLADAQASLAAIKYRDKPAVKGKKVHWCVVFGKAWVCRCFVADIYDGMKGMDRVYAGCEARQPCTARTLGAHN